MNQFEYGFLALFFCFQILYLRWRGFSLIQSISSALFTLPACFISIEMTSQYLTCDDSYIFYEMINFSSGKLASWEACALRTTTAVSGTAIVLIENFFGLTKDLITVLAKGIHTLLGLSILLIITEQINRHYLRSASKVAVFALVFTSGALLPVVNLALHTLNYDLLSMELGVLALIWLGAGLRDGDKRLLTGSAAVSALAAQEKLIASPILWICVILATVKFIGIYKEQGKKSLQSLFLSALVPFTCSIASLLATYLLVIIMRFDNAPEGGVLSALFQPYLMSLWPLVRIFIDPIETAFLMKNIIKGSNAGLIAAAYCIMASFIGIVSYLLLRMGKYFKQKKWNNKFRWFFFSKLPFIQFFMLLSMIMIGTVSTFFLNAFYSPLVPVQEGHYIPALTFNGIALAYGAATLVGHTIFSCAFACATFVNAIPTPVMGIIVLIGGLKIIKRKDEKNNNKIIYLDILSILSLIMILFYGLFQIPLIPRYMNLFLLLFTVTGISGISFVNIKEKTHKYLLLCAWIAVFVIEVIPFRPGLVTFRPLWSNLSEEFNNDPSFGRNPPWYTGWGEEVKLAGERIHNMYKDSLLSGEKIRVFHNYPGSWIRNPEEIELVHMVPGFDSYEYGDRCFYLFTRAGVSFSNIPFPYNIQPIFTIDDRGFVKVWVFRAKDIREAGIKFAPNVPDSK